MSRRVTALSLALCGLALATPGHASDAILLARAPARTEPAVLATPDGLEVSRAGTATRIALPAGARVAAIEALGSGWLPSRAEPVPLVSRGVLSGLLWLEGAEETEYAVRWASWNGSGFDAPVVVAAPGPGSQLALRAATLSDGRALAVWAAFDGNDDEIQASVLGTEGWSRPVRVGADNRVPDITPTVVADDGGGARIAWCRFDGSEYRVATARFDGERFTETALQGPPGSLFPTFERLGEQVSLLWFDAGRDAWVVADPGADGFTERASVPGSSDRRPAVVRTDSGVGFRFGDEPPTAVGK